jgi:hypothetical protein
MQGGNNSPSKKNGVEFFYFLKSQMINNSWKILIIRILIKDLMVNLKNNGNKEFFLMMNLKNICKFKEFDDEFWKTLVGNKEFLMRNLKNIGR